MASGDVGGKAAGLAWLSELGVPVPPFRALPASAFRAHLRRGDVPAALGEAMLAIAEVEPGTPPPAAVSARLRAAVEGAELDEATRAEIATALEELGPGPYAVRSSMVGEDSARHSFAGQLDSELFLDGADAVLGAVRRCWASAFGERALAYSVRIGLSPATVRMGLVIQRMVDADASGVLFTANPVSGDPAECVLAAVYGLGEGVVSGTTDADEYLWSPLDGERSATVARKDVQVVRSASGGGTEQAPVPPELSERRVLAPEQVAAVAELGLRIAAAAGRPMDVEWCLGGGELYVLQARPVTSLPAGGGPPRSFDNSNIQESYNGVTTPLTFSFASRAYATVFRSMLQALGVPRRSVAEFEPAARTLLALIRGRVYYNLASWQHMLSLFPGGRRRTEEVATVMWHTELAAPTAERGSLRRRAETAAVAARLVLHFVRLRREIERFLAHFDATYAGVDRARLADASLTELYATSHRLYAGLLDHWDAPNINDLRVTMTCGRLRRLLERLYEEGEVDARLADLLGGIDGIESVAPTQLLVSVAEAARRDEAAAAALRSGDATDALDRLRERAPVIADRVDRYMDLYGDRGIGELKLETTPPRDDPSFVVEVLRGYLDRPDLRAGDLVASERDRFRAAAADLARRVPAWRRPLLRREVALARTAVKARETMRLRRTRAFALARDVYRGMGRRLHEAGVLEDPRDVLYLTVDELEGFVEGRAVSAELAPLVAARRAEYARYESEEAPNRLEAAGSPYLGIGGPQPSAGGAANGHGAGRTLRGLGCCAGVVDGSVRILTDARDGLALNGRILCTVRTDPGWAPLFPMVSGLIVERGSALSHSAVVARELGIPTVVGVPDVTRILEEGETVRLDGAAGTVERLG